MTVLGQIPASAVFAWSPSDLARAQIVSGSAAGMSDDSFSADSELAIWSLESSATSADAVAFVKQGAISCGSRFNRVAWSAPVTQQRRGVIATGSDNGEVTLWNPAGIEASDSSQSKLFSHSLHSGPVRGLEFNPSEPHLLASAAGKGELYVYDIKDINTCDPKAPGFTPARIGDISSLSWNRKTSHILATSSFNGIASIWDLRNKREFASLSYSGPANSTNAFSNNAPLSLSAVQWDPSNATRLVTASDEDNMPVIMLWDLRNARTPEKVLSGHQKGVLSLSWCQSDASMLLSSGRDGQTFCWSLNSGEIIASTNPATNWTFQSNWCPRNPNLIATASVDDQIKVHSLQAITSDDQAPQVPSKDMCADGSDLFDNPIPYAAAPTVSLKVAPTWFKRPVSATFAHDGKLFTCRALSSQNGPKGVQMRAVITEPRLFDEMKSLETAVKTQKFDDLKTPDTDNDADWRLLTLIKSAQNQRDLLALLPMNRDNSENKMVSEPGQKETGRSAPDPQEQDQSGSGLELTEATDFFSSTPISLPQSPVKHEKFPPEGRTRLVTSHDDEVERDLTQKLLLTDYAGAVDTCLKHARYADALLIATKGEPELVDRAQKAFLAANKSSPALQLFETVLRGNVESMVAESDLSEWQNLFTLICTSTPPAQFKGLMRVLGQRLESAEGADTSSALLCFMASGDLVSTVRIWTRLDPGLMRGVADAKPLVTIMRKIAAFRAVASQNQQTSSPVNGDTELYLLYRAYATLLCSQGLVQSASSYINLLPESYVKENSVVGLEKQRLNTAISQPKTAATRVAGFNQHRNVNAAGSIGSMFQPPPQTNQSARPDTQVQTPENAMRPPPQPMKPTAPTAQSLSAPPPQPIRSASPIIKPTGGWNDAPPSRMPSSTNTSRSQMIASPFPNSAPSHAVGHAGSASPNIEALPPPPRAPGRGTTPVPQPQGPSTFIPSLPSAVLHSAQTPSTEVQGGPPPVQESFQSPYAPPPSQFLPRNASGMQSPPLGVSSQAQATSRPSSAAPVRHMPKFPPGDRSQISDEDSRIVDVLNGALQNLRMVSPPQQKRQLDDCQRRLDSMFDAMNCGELSPDTIDMIHGITVAMSQGDPASALAAHVALITSPFPGHSDMLSWMQAVKLLINRMAVGGR